MGMTISKEYRVEAMHFLPGHRGLCANEHGHSYRIAIEVTGGQLFQPDASDDQMVVDYGEIDEVMKPLIKQLDHSNLNESALRLLGVTRTTAEALALGIFEDVAHVLRGDGYELKAVRVSETLKTWAEWRP